MGIDFPRLLGYNHLTNQKEEGKMTNNEKNLIELIRGSEDPERMEAYMLNLSLEYLRIHAPDQYKQFEHLQVDF